MRTVAVLALALALAGPGAAQAAAPLTEGFFDGGFAGPAATRDPLLGKAGSVGAQALRVDVGWPAATRPAHPTDPADPAYSFAAADAAVRAATARGFAILATFTGAPSWAQGAHRPRSAGPGTWRPSAAAVGAYGQALARRYDGTYPDPQQPGATLPRVAAFQPWNEPNLSTYLTPQWKGSRHVAPVVYRNMLNAFYAGVKAASPAALVVTAGTAPFGDFGHGRRTMPVPFWKTVLARPVRFDVLSHHPYSVGGPSRHALNAGDVSIPDMGKLSRLLRAAAARGTIHGHKRLWVTEVAYDSKPPDPQGVAAATQARWLEQTLYLLWRQHVDTVFWYLVQDQPPVPSYAASNQGGVYLLTGRAKPSATAFRFPVVATRRTVWTNPWASGTLRVERKVRRAWRTIATREVRVRRIAQVHVALPRGARIRGVLGGLHSVTWRVG